MEKWLRMAILLFLSGSGLLVTRPILAQQVVKYGSIPIIGELPFHAAEANGYFTEQGIRTTREIIVAGAMLIPAMAGGSLDVGYSAYLHMFQAREQGFDVLAIFPFTQSTPGKDPSVMVALEESKVRRPKDLEGKTVAQVTIRGLNYLYTLEWLAKNDVDHTKVKVVEIPFPNMFPVLRARTVDAAFATEPFITPEREKGGVRILGYPFTEVAPLVEVAGVIALEKWVKANRDLVGRFTKALLKGMEYVNAHPEKRAELLARYTRLQPELVPKLIQQELRFPLDTARLQEQADLALKWGLLKKKHDVKAAAYETALAIR